MRVFEAPPRPPPGLRRVLADLGPSTLANGVLGLVFAASGPLAIVLSVGTAGGLAPDALASWIFGIFFVNGLITVGMSWVYRQPLAFFWTIPGAVLVGPALKHFSLPEVVGAYLVTGVLILVVGATGWVRRAMNAVPMPIVMAMVAGVFLRFGLDLVRGVHADPVLGAAMVGVFVALSALPSWAGASRRSSVPWSSARRSPGGSAASDRPRPARSRWRGRRSSPRPSPCPRSSSSFCPSRSRCWWCRTARASRCSRRPATSRR